MRYQAELRCLSGVENATDAPTPPTAPTGSWFGSADMTVVGRTGRNSIRSQENDTRIYLARDLKRDLLPHFAQPADAPDPVKFAKRVQRPWCDAGFFSFDVPQNSMPNYAQAYAQCVADAILLACCDGTRPEDRKRLVIAIIQIGIDHYGLGALRGKPPCAWQSSPCLPHGRPLGIWPSCPGALPDRPRIVYGALRGRPHDIRPIRPGVPGGRPHLFPGARRGRLLAV